MANDDYNAPIEFTAAGETDEQKEMNLRIVKPSPGFEPTEELVADAIVKDANVTVLDYTANQVNVRYQIDGIWHAGAPMDRETGDYMLATMKQLAGLDYRERVRRQEGNFGTFYGKMRQKFKLVSQGVQTGERVALYLDYKRPPLDTTEQLGMRGSVAKQLKTILSNEKTGVVLVSAVPGEGYTTAWRGVLDLCDRLTRDYYVLEEVGKNEPEVINIYPIEFDPAKGEDALSPVPQLLLKEPDVLAFPEIPTGDLLNRIVEVGKDKQIPMFVRNPGKHCADALMRLIAKKPDVPALIDRLDAVVCMRVIRLLCEDCKVGYAPHPSLLQRLGLPPGRVAELFQPFVYQPGMLDEDEKEIEPCQTCSGIGFRGRTGIFEVLTMTDEIRATAKASPRVDKLDAAAKQLGHVSMLMEGVVLIAKGATSLEELQRVLKS